MRFVRALLLFTRVWGCNRSALEDRFRKSYLLRLCPSSVVSRPSYTHCTRQFEVDRCVSESAVNVMLPVAERFGVEWRLIDS